MLGKPVYLHSLQQEVSRLKDENQTLRSELITLRQTIRALCELQEGLDQITPQTDVFVLLNRLISLALEAVNSLDGSLQLRDEETHELVFVAVHGRIQDSLTGYRLPAGIGISGWVVETRQPHLVADARLEPRFSPLIDEAFGMCTNSLICAPLFDGDRILGAIEAVNTSSGEPFREQDLDILMLVAHLASIALVRAEGPRPDKSESKY